MTVFIFIRLILLPLAVLLLRLKAPTAVALPPQGALLAQFCGRGIHEMGGRVDEMKKAELMKYAASLGVPTRKPAAPTQWRAVKDVREDCKLREAAQRQPSPARAGEPGAASSDLAAPSVSHGSASVQVPARVGEPGAASSGLAAPSVSRGPASVGAPGARAGGSGSSSLSQAQVAPSAPATVARKPVVGAADVTSSDVRNMNIKELRALATSLGVGTRENTKSSEALRAACCRALLQAPQRQHSRAGASEPGAASSDLAAPAASREPASGSPTASSSQAQVKSSVAATATQNPVAGAAHVTSTDVQNMNNKELRALAVSLGVAARDTRKSTRLLRSACCRALKGQVGIASFFQPAVAPGAPGGEGGDAPVSDSASAVDPNPAKPRERPRAVRKPLWLRKPAWLSAQTARQKKVRKRLRKRRTQSALRKDRIHDKIRDKRPDRKKLGKKRYQQDLVKREKNKHRVLKSRREAPRANRRPVMPKSARAERAGVLGREGSWKRTAEESARLCQQDGPSHLPPCYAGLDQEHQRRLTSQMCGCLEDVQWATCVVCWRAWYDLPAEYEFSYTQQGLRAQQAPWFDPGASVITRAGKKSHVNQWRLEAAGSVEEAQCYLAANYPSGECESIARRLHDPERKRIITICGGCHMHVGEDHVLPPPAGEMRMCDFVVDPVWCTPRSDGPAIAHERFDGVPPPGPASEEAFSRVLGFSVGEFAHPVAALSDHEEMVLALVHPLVQVYTIPRTGQLAYVGHICNFRQKVSKFLKSLPVMPADMPVVHVRPRALGSAGAKGKSAGRALFKVDISKLKAAFLWLKANNPYYAEVEWRDDAAEAWAGDDVEVGTTREADSDASHVPPVTPTCFVRWMEHGRTEAVAGDFGYAIGNRLREVISDGDSDDEDPGPAGAAGSRAWAEVRRLVADVFGKSVFRMATTLPQDILAVALAARGILDLGLPRDGDATHALRALRSLDTNDCPVDLHVSSALSWMPS